MGWQPDEKQLVYDLRQIYANEIVGNTIKTLQVAFVTENYPLWYHTLKRDLFIEISIKLDDKEKKLVREKVDEIKPILRKYSQVYIGKGKDAEGHEKIEDALGELTMLLLGFMEKHKMFGSKEEIEPL